MPRTAKASSDTAELDAQGYNRFVAGVQPRQIELGQVEASARPSELREVNVQVDSKFVMSCPQYDVTARTFDVDARLELRFLAEDQREVGQFNCLYRLTYQSDVPLTDAFLNEFTRRNAPVNVWPFMRELVMNLTQRFGWSGFVLPSFLIPALPTNPEPARATGDQPARKTRKKATAP